jgi:hypothetical protein
VLTRLAQVNVERGTVGARQPGQSRALRSGQGRLAKVSAKVITMYDKDEATEFTNSFHTMFNFDMGPAVFCINT